MTTNWKLPDHLEPYRELITYLYPNKSLEFVVNESGNGNDRDIISHQVSLLQRLYDAGRLK